MRSCRIALVLATIISTSLFAASSPTLYVPSIEQYYKDISYVATHSDRKEQMAMVAYMSGKAADDSFLKDKRLKPVFDKLKSIWSARLGVDPDIFRGPFGNYSVDCSSTAEPTEVISQSSDRMIIKVNRTSVGSTDTWGTPASSIKKLLQAPRSQGWSFEEIDTWLLVDGKWRLYSLHIYLI